MRSLQHNAKLASQAFHGIILVIYAINLYHATSWFIEPADKVYDGGFTAACFTNKRYRCSCINVQV